MADELTHDRQSGREQEQLALELSELKARTHDIEERVLELDAKLRRFLEKLNGPAWH